MSLGRMAGWLTGVVSIGLLVVTVWLLSLDTRAQAYSIYPATGLVVLIAVVLISYAVRTYQRLDELAQKIHLQALSVAFVGTLMVVASWTLVAALGLVDRSVFLRSLLSPTPRDSASLYLLAVMLGLYLVGWLWGRSRYR